MDRNQNQNKKKERQTGIIDDAAAIAMMEAQAQQGRRGRSKKGGGKGKQGFNFSKAQNAGVTKPKPKVAPHSTGAPKAHPGPQKGNIPKSKTAFTNSASAEARFYEEDGLRIPLFDKSGRRNTHAKDANVNTAKYGRPYLLGIVQDYAGEDKVQEFETAKSSKKEIAAWIQAVETKAFGNGPAKGNGAAMEGRKVGMAPNRAPAPPKSRNESGKQKSMARSEDANTRPTNTYSQNGVNGQNKRKRDDDTPATLDQQTTKKTKVEHSQPTTKSIQAGPPHGQTRLQKNQNQHQNPQTRPQSIEQEMAPSRNYPQQHQKPSAIPQPNKQGNVPSYRRATVSSHNKAGIHATETFKSTKPMKKPAVSDRDMDLYIPKMDSLSKDQQHPLIPALDLDPRWDPLEPGMPPGAAPTRILNLPGQRAHAIVTAESDTTVHVTEIPYKDTRKHASSVPQLQQQQGKQSQAAAPYLKPGPHGYDDENHRWHFPSSDSSLVTGVGHQVEPADASGWESVLLRAGRQSDLVKSLHGEVTALNAHINALKAVRSEEVEGPELCGLVSKKERKEQLMLVAREKLKEMEGEKDTFMRKYRVKYPGTTVGQWPCGCARVGSGAWEEGDSEEE